VNRATNRLHAPALGRWNEVDPDAEMYGRLSPYNSMLNSPMVHNDPNGDNPLLIGAGIGFLMNGINNVSNGQGFFQGGGKAAIIGGAQGVFSAGIGDAAGVLSSKIGALGTGLFQAGAHGLTGGLFAGANGGSFGSGFLSGAASSGVGSLIGSSHPLAQIGAGGLSGGVSSVIGGGNFWSGLGQGLITSGLNHAADELSFRINIKNALKDPDFIKKLMCACIDAYSPKSPDLELFDIILDNDYANHRNVKWGNVRRFEAKLTLNGYQYDFYVSAKHPTVKFEDWGISGMGFSKDINQLYNHSMGRGADQRPGFFVNGNKSGSMGARRLITISTTDLNAGLHLSNYYRFLRKNY